MGKIINMNIIFFTGNSPRHIALCNKVSKLTSKNLIISEVKEDYSILEEANSSEVRSHFKERLITEISYFEEYGSNFESDSIALKYGQSSSLHIENQIKKFNPDCAIISGSSVLKKNIIDALGNIPKINLHLGITPYFRGSGCNFWPLYFKKPEYIGATLLDLDLGIDEGAIIHQFNEFFNLNDNIHSIGNRVIKKSIGIICEIVKGLKQKKLFKLYPQIYLSNTKTFKNKDFNQSSLQKYKNNLEKGLLNISEERYREVEEKLIKLTWLS
tara:strand:- start:12063 stop:12875 length:813 start_codon:yes stop_codon:yes gene_type:complete